MYHQHSGEHLCRILYPFCKISCMTKPGQDVRGHMSIFHTNGAISMWDVAASILLLFLIPICLLPSLTSHRDSLVHRSVSHLLFAEGSRQDRRCCPSAGGVAANPDAKQTRAGAETTFDLSAECPHYDYFKLGAFDSFSARRGKSSVLYFPVISDDCGGEQIGNVHHH